MELKRRRIIAAVLATLLLTRAWIVPSGNVNAQEKKTAFAEPKLKFADWVSGNQVSVRWKKVRGAQGYCLYRSRREDGKYKRITTNKGNINVRAIVREKRAKAGYYKVKAFKTVKNKRVYSACSNIVYCPRYKKSPLGYLFPSGPPRSPGAMNKYLVSVHLPVRVAGGGKSYITLPIHRKLVKRVKACFKDMYKIGFKVRRADTGSFNWRKMSTINLQSHHSYGCVIDLNWQANPMIKLSQIGRSAYNPRRNSYSINKKVVKIWKSHGFYWGGDWTEKKDYMHMTFTNN